MKKILEKYGVDAIVVVLFAVISFAYFMPADMENRVLYQHDASAGTGLGQEISQYKEQTGELSRWTNAAFSGMPTYQTAPSYESESVLSQALKAYHLWLPEYVWYVFVYLLGFYILLRAFDFRQWMAALGAVVWAFSSYFFIIIAAGHIWKVMALAYLPPMIAGVVLAYRGRYLWGFVVTAVFTAFEVSANHVQMTYYYLFVILFMVLAFLADALKKGLWRQFVKATAVCIAAAAVGLCCNVSNLYHTWQYGQESMRGKSELVKKNAENQTDGGLDRDYIVQWSYGIDETWTLLIPNAKGGSHHITLAQDEKAMQKADPQFAEFLGNWYQYWGEQPFTAGPVYAGAFVVFLFVLGIFIVKGPMKWALLGVTVLSILLSWGKNFMPFTNIFIDYMPMYAKFRTVSSILVIAEFSIPLLAMMALKRIVDHPEVLKQEAKWFYASVALTAGACLLFALVPSLYQSQFLSAADTAQLKQYVPEEYFSQIADNLSKIRQVVFTQDCWRSFWIIMLGVLLLLLYRFKKLPAMPLVGLLLVICLADMWMVNKRYLYDEMFVEASVREAPQEKTPTDEQILQDKALDYRVLNLASNTFNENETSYYHKSIGGYHAAKLRRYQEMIDAYIAPEMQTMMPAIAEAAGDMTQVKGDSIFPVLNMLNAKYFILPLQGGQTVPVKNPYVYGNAWLVDKVSYVDNANDELRQVGEIDLRHEAVADAKFKDQLGQSQLQEGASVVTITQYKPNELTYDVKTGKGGVVVFSEVYYPGWTATIDGKPAELGRVNYILRALKVGAGEHQVVLTFKPKSIERTETLAYVSYALLFLAIVAGIFVEVRKRKPEHKNAE